MDKINLTNADIGRHLKNGELFIKEGIIIKTNFYSYTQPDFPVVTHHWFSGVIFYIVSVLFGFSGLSLFYALLSGLTVYIVYLIAASRSKPLIAMLFTLTLLPLMADRREIRPEVFSYLLLVVYFYLFDKLSKGKISFKRFLQLIIPLQLLWVNTHIFFVMGFMLAGLSLLEDLIKKASLSSIKEKGIILLFLVLISLFNPYFFSGLLEPLNIFKEYGYQLIENASLLFLQKFAPTTKYFVIEILALFTFLVTVNVAFTNKIKSYFTIITIVTVFLVLSFKAIRGIPMFAMFLAPLFSQYYFDNLSKNNKGLIILNIILGSLLLVKFLPHNFGLGLLPKNNASAEFFLSNNIQGPIFNNYDIGGYLIYALYEKELVFVDNRPEAYSVEFFKKTYIPMQENEELWETLQEQYNFNAIFFNRRDITNWAQAFLINRVRDDVWVPIYVDDNTIIFIKNIDQNADLISKHKLPKNYFVVT